MAWLQDDAAIRSEAVAILLRGSSIGDLDLSKGADSATPITVRLDALCLVERIFADTKPRDMMQGYGEHPNWRDRNWATR
jgi:hypothetical protein